MPDATKARFIPECQECLALKALLDDLLDTLLAARHRLVERFPCTKS
jgi:hypothetical protein